MKIFVTGSTGMTTGTRKHVPMPIIDMTQSMVQDLRELGHDVTWEPVLTDDIPQCDLMVATLNPIFTPFVPFAISASFGLALAWERGIPTVFYFDDWQFPYVWSSYSKWAENIEKQMRKTRSGFNMYLGDVDAMLQRQDLLQEWAFAFANNDPKLWDTSLAIASKFRGWGDIQIFRDIVGQESFISFDPTPLVYEYVEFSCPIPERRHRRWMHAGLKTHEQWIKKQELGWDYDIFGPYKHGYVRLKGDQKVYEEQCKRWGHLVPAYPQDGSGYFQTRYVLAAEAQAIVLTGEKNQRALGPAFTFTPPEVENLSDTALKQLGQEHSWQLKSMFTRDRSNFTEDIETMVRTIMDKVGVTA